jgi:hypothetical protein
MVAAVRTVELAVRILSFDDGERPTLRKDAADKHDLTGAEDPGLRRMMTWVAVALVVTLALGFLVVEITLRWFGR